MQPQPQPLYYYGVPPGALYVQPSGVSPGATQGVPVQGQPPQRQGQAAAPGGDGSTAATGWQQPGQGMASGQSGGVTMTPGQPPSPAPATATGGGVDAGAARPPLYGPLVDVIEKPAEVEVLIDMPGFEEDDIQLDADAQTLRVAAERTESHDVEVVAIQRERPVRLERTIQIPVHVELDEASAVYEAGVCRVRLPKREGETGTQTKIGFH